MWFEESCQEMFMSVEVQAKQYIDATETEKSISVNTKDHTSNDVVETYSGLTSPPQNNSGMIGVQSIGNQNTNKSASNTSVVNNQENNQNTAGDSCGIGADIPGQRQRELKREQTIGQFEVTTWQKQSSTNVFYAEKWN